MMSPSKWCVASSHATRTHTAPLSNTHTLSPTHTHTRTHTHTPPPPKVHVRVSIPKSVSADERKALESLRELSSKAKVGPFRF